MERERGNDHYFAFISHKSCDDKIALKIQKRLETYRIPQQTRKEEDIGSKFLSPIFVDKNELRSSGLRDEIDERLRHSNKLIVLCSRESAKPTDVLVEWEHPEKINWTEDIRKTGWVGYEIARFMEKNPDDKKYKDIIHIVIDGEPDEGNCFHPLLKQYIDSGELYFFKYTENNYPDIVEAILTPQNREAFRQRNIVRSRIKMALRILAFILICAGVVFAWNYYCPHKSFYADYVLVDGMPNGIVNLSEKEARNREEYYQITTQKSNKTCVLEHMNSVGVPVEDDAENHPDAFMIAKFKSRDNGKADTVEITDRNGIVQIAYSYATDLAYVTFQENEFVSTQVYPVAEINDYGIPNRMTINRYDLTYDAVGRVVIKQYKHGENYVVDDDGVAGEKYEYDDAGRITGIYYLDVKGERCQKKNGVGGVEFTYDMGGFVSSKKYVKSDGTATYGIDGYARRVRESDGSEVTYRYYGTSDEPIVCKQRYAKAVHKYNDRGLIESIMYYGLDDEPVYSQLRCHEIRYSYDDAGNKTDTGYYGFDDNLIQGKDGYAQEKCRFDKKAL